MSLRTCAALRWCWGVHAGATHGGVMHGGVMHGALLMRTRELSLLGTQHGGADKTGARTLGVPETHGTLLKLRNMQCTSECQSNQNIVYVRSHKRTASRWEHVVCVQCKKLYMLLQNSPAFVMQRGNSHKQESRAGTHTDLHVCIHMTHNRNTKKPSRSVQCPCAQVCG